MKKNLSMTDMVRGLGAGLLLVLVAAAPVVAAPQLMAGYGDQWAWRSADINGMGGTGTALYRGGLSNIYNPALLADETGARLDLSVSLDQESEDRFQPLFDTFDSWVTDASIAANRNHFFQAGFGYARSLENLGAPLTVGLSLADRYPYQYDFSEELRNPDPFVQPPERDMIIENRTRQVEGTLRNLSLGVGADVAEALKVGASVHYAFGTRTDTWTVRDFDTSNGDSSYNHVYEQDLDGVNFTLGATVRVNERVELGLALETPLSVTGDFSEERHDPTGAYVIDESVDGEIKYPKIYRAGLAFFPRTDPATQFTIELEYMPWSELEDSRFAEGDAGLHDTMDVRVGLQHTFYNGVPVRFGFRHYDSYVDDEASASAFSAGVGMPFGSGLFSFTVELSKMTAIMDHQFPYPPGYYGSAYEADPQARVEDSRFRLGAGYTLNF
jgi:hypothetical protein